jgi:hypothetical protein
MEPLVFVLLLLLLLLLLLAPSVRPSVRPFFPSSYSYVLLYSFLVVAFLPFLLSVL